MARWKACVEFLLSVRELLFLSLMAEALQGKMCQNCCLQEGVGHLEARFQGERVSGEDAAAVAWLESAVGQGRLP